MKSKIVRLDNSPAKAGNLIKRMLPVIVASLLGLALIFAPQSSVVVFAAAGGRLALQVFVVIVSLIMIAASARKQALWDKIAKTKVVRS